MAERTFVEAVDLALDILDQLEVVGQHLVGDRGDEARGVERTEARLTLGRRVEPRERREWLVVDGHDPVPAGHDVDRATDQMRSVQLPIVRGRLGDLEDQVDVLGIERQVGSLGRVGQLVQRLGPRGRPRCRRHRGQRRSRPCTSIHSSCLAPTRDAISGSSLTSRSRPSAS